MMFLINLFNAKIFLDLLKFYEVTITARFSINNNFVKFYIMHVLELIVYRNSQSLCFYNIFYFKYDQLCFLTFIKNIIKN